jgi:transposase
MKKNKSLNLGIVNNRILIVGVDSGKKLNFARFLFPEGQISKPFSFKNTKSGFTQLEQRIRFSLEKGQGKSVIVGIESTGHYWKPFVYHFDKLPDIRLVQVNPAHVKKAKEIYDSSPGKTDLKDPAVIAMLIQMGRFQELRLPKGEYASLRVYARQREQKVTELGVQRNILHSLVDPIFPEYGSVFLKLESKTSLYVLDHYPTPALIVNLGIKRLTTVLKKVSRGQLRKDRAQELFRAASLSIGVREGVDAVIFSIRSTIENIKRLQEKITEIEKLMTASLHKISYAEHLLSIHGIGPVTLSTILGEIGDITQYRRAEEIIKLAGLNLYEISSGKHRGRRRITKRGRPLLRKTLFFAALRMVKTKGIFRQDYLRLTEGNKMQKTKALIALSRKLLRVIFALCRDNVSYGSTKAKSVLAA